MQSSTALVVEHPYANITKKVCDFLNVIETENEGYETPEKKTAQIAAIIAEVSNTKALSQQYQFMLNMLIYEYAYRATLETHYNFKYGLSAKHLTDAINSSNRLSEEWPWGGEYLVFALYDLVNKCDYLRLFLQSSEMLQCLTNTSRAIDKMCKSLPVNSPHLGRMMKWFKLTLTFSTGVARSLTKTEIRHNDAIKAFTDRRAFELLYQGLKKERVPVDPADRHQRCFNYLVDTYYGLVILYNDKYILSKNYTLPDTPNPILVQTVNELDKNGIMDFLESAGHDQTFLNESHFVPHINETFHFYYDLIAKMHQVLKSAAASNYKMIRKIILDVDVLISIHHPQWKALTTMVEFHSTLISLRERFYNLPGLRVCYDQDVIDKQYRITVASKDLITFLQDNMKTQLALYDQAREQIFGQLAREDEQRQVILEKIKKARAERAARIKASAVKPKRKTIVATPAPVAAQDETVKENPDSIQIYLDIRKAKQSSFGKAELRAKKCLSDALVNDDAHSIACAYLYLADTYAHWAIILTGKEKIEKLKLARQYYKYCDEAISAATALNIPDLDVLLDLQAFIQPYLNTVIDETPPPVVSVPAQLLPPAPVIAAPKPPRQQAPPAPAALRSTKFDMNKRIPDYVKAIMDMLHRKHEVFIVGGIPRGELLKETVQDDFDILTSATQDEIIALLKDKGFVAGSYPIFHVHKVKPDHKPIQISWMKGTLLEDLKQRDFTVNTFCYDPYTKTMHYLDQAMDHINKRSLVFINPPEQSVLEDASRIIRAIRLSAKADLVMSNEVSAILHQHAGRLTFLPARTLWHEMSKTFQITALRRVFLFFRETNLLTQVYGMTANESERCLLLLQGMHPTMEREKKQDLIWAAITLHRFEMLRERANEDLKTTMVCVMKNGNHGLFPLLVYFGIPLEHQKDVLLTLLLYHWKSKQLPDEELPRGIAPKLKDNAALMVTLLHGEKKIDQPAYLNAVIQNHFLFKPKQHTAKKKAVRARIEPVKMTQAPAPEPELPLIPPKIVDPVAAPEPLKEISMTEPVIEHSAQPPIPEPLLPPMTAPAENPVEAKPVTQETQWIMGVTTEQAIRMRRPLLQRRVEPVAAPALASQMSMEIKSETATTPGEVKSILSLEEKNYALELIRSGLRSIKLPKTSGDVNRSSPLSSSVLIDEAGRAFVLFKRPDTKLRFVQAMNTLQTYEVKKFAYNPVKEIESLNKDKRFIACVAVEPAANESDCCTYISRKLYQFGLLTGRYYVIQEPVTPPDELLKPLLRN